VTSDSAIPRIVPFGDVIWAGNRKMTAYVGCKVRCAYWPDSEVTHTAFLLLGTA